MGKRKEKCTILDNKFYTFTFLKVLAMVLSFLTNVFVVRKLTTGDFGTYSLILIVLGLTMNLGVSWHSSSIIYFGIIEKENRNKINETFWARNLILFICSTIVFLIFLILNNKIRMFTTFDDTILILIWFIVRGSYDYLTNYFIALDNQVNSALVQVLSKLLFIILTLCLNIDVNKIVLIGIISELIPLVFIFKINIKELMPVRVNMQWLKEMLDFSIWQLIGFIGVYIVNFGDNYVIKSNMNNEAVGIYNIAYQLYMGVSALYTIINSYYTPKIGVYINEKDTSNLKKIYDNTKNKIMFIVVIMNLVLIIFSDLILKIMYGAKGELATNIFRILIFGSTFYFINTFYYPIFNFLRKHKQLQFINIIQAAVNIILDIVLIKYFGILGPAIATGVAIFISCIFTVYMGRRLIKNLH